LTARIWSEIADKHSRGSAGGDRQGGDHPGDLVAERSVLIGGADAHRDEHLQLEVRDVLAAPLEVPAQRERHDAQYDVVDGPAAGRAAS
jgi:hypothetical protein